MRREMLYVWLMPWAEFESRFNFGSIEIWNFYKEGPKRITDTQEMLWLSQLMSCFKDKNGNELLNIGVMQSGVVAFNGHGSAEGNYRVRWAADAISFAHTACAIQNYLLGRGPVTAIGSSERFRIMILLIDEDGFLHYTGPDGEGVSDVASKFRLFIEPQQMGPKLHVPNRLLLDGLSLINDNQHDTELWLKLEICFEWFATAWSNSPDFSIPARFVALMTAFESLVKNGSNDRSPAMADTTETICGWENLPRTEVFVKNGTVEQVSKAKKFIIDFGGYRNNYVHGSTRIRWGLVKHCVGDIQLDARHVMSMVIYSIVSNLLIKAGVFKTELEIAMVKADLKRIIDTLGWDTTTLMTPSPHENYTRLQ